MKKPIYFAGINFFIALILCTTNAGAQNKKSVTISTGNEHIVKSEFNQKPYHLYVSLPKNYSTKDTIHYPVLYVLDGKFSYGSFKSTREMLDLAREIKNVIIVAIENECETDTDWLVARHFDLTPSFIPSQDTLWGKILQIPQDRLKSGGAPLFLNTLEKDIIPYIEKNYKTTGDRGLSGHSLGGLFTAYCLLNKPSLFTRYGINSPSFWWNSNEMLATVNTNSDKLSGSKARIFFSVGALEGDMMVNPLKTFVESLKNKNLNGVQMTVQIFDAETHVSVTPVSGCRTLKVLYGSAVN